MSDISASSSSASETISQINVGIDQVAQVVQQNSATAQESAATSQEMNSQSEMLNSLVSHFKLRDGEEQAMLPSMQRAITGAGPSAVIL